MEGVFSKLPLSSSLGCSGYIPLFASLASRRNLPERQTLVNPKPQSWQSILLFFMEPWGQQFNLVVQHQCLLGDMDLLP